MPSERDAEAGCVAKLLIVLEADCARGIADEGAIAGAAGRLDGRAGAAAAAAGPD